MARSQFPIKVLATWTDLGLSICLEGSDLIYDLINHHERDVVWVSPAATLDSNGNVSKRHCVVADSHIRSSVPVTILFIIQRHECHEYNVRQGGTAKKN